MEGQLTDIPFKTSGLDVSTIYAHWQDPARLTHGAVINMDFVLTLFQHQGQPHINSNTANSSTGIPPFHNYMLDKFTHRPQHPSHGLFIQNINFPFHLMQHGHCMNSLVHPSTQSAE